MNVVERFSYAPAPMSDEFEEGDDERPFDMPDSEELDFGDRPRDLFFERDPESFDDLDEDYEGDFDDGLLED